MSGRVLLDTNVVIALFANEAAIQQNLAVAVEVFVPAVVLGELHYGARKSAKAAENEARIAAFAAKSSVLPCDVVTARHYGEVKNGLRVKGQPIPENDVWVAATAIQHGLTLITRDSHFDAVEGLRFERW